MGTAASPPDKSRVDGRRAWRERNRNAVVDALLDLYQEGNLRPGAQEIAERSGVSRRSLFRYFDDMDDLCRVAIERHADRVRHLFEIERIGEGTLAERIDRLVEQRVRLYQTIAPVRRLAITRAPFEPALARRMKEADGQLRAQVRRHFAPELEAMPADERDATLAAADTITSFAAYEQLTTAAGKSRGEIAEAIRLALLKLLSR